MRTAPSSRYVDAMLPTLARLAIPRLQIEPDHQLLEIGCGNGSATAAVAEQLTTGCVLAIDRSAAPVAKARQRNADHIARGVVRVEQVDFSRLVVAEGQFVTIYALNVNIFQAYDRAVMETIRRALRRQGRLVLGFGNRDSSRLARRAEQVSVLLQSGGLAAPVLDWAAPRFLFLTATRR